MFFEFVWQGGQGVLIGESAELTADKTVGKLCCNHLSWVNIYDVHMHGFLFPRKGSFVNNTALGEPKGKGKGKKTTVFPVLQVGGDPYSTLPNVTLYSDKKNIIAPGMLQDFVEIGGKKIDQAEELKAIMISFAKTFTVPYPRKRWLWWIQTAVTSPLATYHTLR